MKKTFLFTLAACAVTNLASAATITHRYSYDSDASDSVGGNDGILVGAATVTGGKLTLTGATGDTAADSMSFTNTLDIGGTYGASGVTFESWYTDTGTGDWGKLFSFGNGQAGSNIIYNLQQGGSNEILVQYNGAGTGNLARPAVNSQHHLVLTVSSTGNLNAWVDGTAIITNIDGDDLSSVTGDDSHERIGASAWGDAGMQGSVDEFRIWEGELSSSDVSANFAAGPDTVVPEPSGLALTLLGGLLAFRRRRA